MPTAQKCLNQFPRPSPERIWQAGMPNLPPFNLDDIDMDVDVSNENNNTDNKSTREVVDLVDSDEDGDAMDTDNKSTPEVVDLVDSDEDGDTEAMDTGARVGNLLDVDDVVIDLVDSDDDK